ncbi:MAG: glutamine-hydrolyzing GMP synthase, partial [Boseongicola sp.]
GKIVDSKRHEFGKTELWLDKQEDSLLFAGLNPNLICWMSHGDVLTRVPRGAKLTAHTDATKVAAFEDRAKGLYAVQFHPEVTHTPWGIDLLRNFVYDGCGAKGDWTMGNFIEMAVEDIRAVAGEHGEVICAVSGGVDSLCTAAIVDRAVGTRLHSIFVDHGFLRHEEGDKVVKAWKTHFQSELIRVNAARRFLTLVKGVSEPERKRKLIGREFIKVFDEHAKGLKGVRFLAQGTLYPDVIESSGIGLHAHVIKTHHNVGGLPKKMKLGLIEPLRDLFKDEVRKLALELELPRPMVYRQPFPGPGLAIRIIGEVTAKRLKILREADKIVRDEIELAEMERPWQYFGVLPAVKSVGVMGDQRTYGYPLIIRAVSSQDAMTADWSKIPFKNLERISSRVIGEVPGINRVCLDVTSKPPGTI